MCQMTHFVLIFFNFKTTRLLHVDIFVQNVYGECCFGTSFNPEELQIVEENLIIRESLHIIFTFGYNLLPQDGPQIYK